MMKVVIGSDENGMILRQKLADHMQQAGVEVTDYNCLLEGSELYPDIANGVCKAVLEGSADRGILICGTGIGMCITANKVPGIRAAVCHDLYSAERSRKSNDAQILCFGALIIGEELAKALLDVWLGCGFCGGRSLPKVERINYYDSLYRKGQRI